MNSEFEPISLAEAVKRIEYSLRNSTDELSKNKLKDVIYLLKRVDRLK